MLLRGLEIHFSHQSTFSLYACDGSCGFLPVFNFLLMRLGRLRDFQSANATFQNMRQISIKTGLLHKCLQGTF